MSAPDPIDSLIYLSRANSIDWVIEQMGVRFGLDDENEDVRELTKTLDGVKDMLRDAAKMHFDGRTQYSTGVPFERVYRAPGIEPDPDGGPDRIVQQEFHVDMNPDGTPEHPYNPVGTWIT
ncbi:hypothetical protein [Corynebacterium sp. HMSC28B08]|uniref:hypothetical protein n=1 Tax=Corynebacterium sp. HMSC28B08 TaxID=1581066 RepID=UPI0008A3FD8F|nr:hypothetical protein [Corynebacterium sp. HMSC28B08]OFT88983.1 hypothetical protein HMPREF3098_06720 [Corynebacterium sp. HMSC28B08]